MVGERRRGGENSAHESLDRHGPHLGELAENRQQLILLRLGEVKAVLLLVLVRVVRVVRLGRVPRARACGRIELTSS